MSPEGLRRARQPQNHRKSPIQRKMLKVKAVAAESDSRNKKLTAFKAPRKRNRNNVEGEPDGPSKGRKAKKPNLATIDPHGIKEWDMLLGGVEFIIGKVVSYNKESTITEIKSVLTPSQYDSLKKSCFGKVVELKNFKVQPQMVHNILFREVFHSRDDELWVDLSGKILRFGIGEFAVMTGLKCIGAYNKASIGKVKGGVYDRYFSRYDGLTREVVHRRFLMKNFETDEDAVKMAMLHLLVNFLMGARVELSVDRSFVDLIDSEDAREVFPWGKEVYAFTMARLKGKLLGKEQMAIKNYNKGLGRSIYYTLRGFILPLQMWFYECCCEAANGIACLPHRETINIPRMLKWKCIGSPKTKYISENFLGLPPNEFKNLVPTAEEQNLLELGDFFNSKNQFLRNDASRHNFESSLARKQNVIGTDIGVLLKDFSTSTLSTQKSMQSAGLCNPNVSREVAAEDAANAFHPPSPGDIEPVVISTQELEENVRSVVGKQTPHTNNYKEKLVDVTDTIGAPPLVSNLDPIFEHEDTLPLTRPSIDALVAGLEDDMISNVVKNKPTAVVMHLPKETPHKLQNVTRNDGPAHSKNIRMGREEWIEIEPVMMHDDSSEKLHPCLDTPETEKRLVAKEHEIQKLMEKKAEPGINYFENQITELTKKLSELQKQVVEKDRAVGAYQDRLKVLETKVGELEEEKWMDNQIIKEKKTKLLKSRVSEEMLSAKLNKAVVRIEEEMKLRELESTRHSEELGRQKVEASRGVEDLRRQLLEAERAAEELGLQLSKAEQSVKKMKERGLEDYEAAKVNSKRFGNVLPKAEELYKLLKMNVDDLVSVKDTFKGLGDPRACKPLELTITKKWYSEETTKMRKPSSTEEKICNENEEQGEGVGIHVSGSS